MTKGKNPTDYEVGYGKPPKHTRFQPGQSGNPKGRDKGKKGLKTDLAAELDARQTIQINGEKISGRRQRLAVRTLAMRAAAGDQKAQSIFFPLILQVLGVEDRGTGRQRLSPQDQAILDAMLDEADDALDADETGSSTYDGEDGDAAG